MKNLKTGLILLFLLCLKINQLSYAQQQTAATPLSACGTAHLSDKQVRWLHNYQQRKTDYSMQSRGGHYDYLPIHFHLVGTDDGTGFYTFDETFRLLCELNVQCEPLGLQFYLDATPTFINNSAYYDHDWAAGSEMMQNNNIEGVINVYMVSSPAGNCGYYSLWNDALSVANGCAGTNSTTLAHELGHYFSMPHTFSGWEGYFDPYGVQDGEPPNNQQERVDGSNCADAGDGFCDTPADYLSYRWGCPYDRDITDPLGLRINPDEKNYMSYSSDNCARYFSPEQIAAIRANVFEERPYLLGNTTITSIQPEETMVVYPSPNAQNIPANNALIAWRRSPNATSYFLDIHQSAASGINISTFVSDTFIVAQLTPSKTYFVLVRPLTDGNTCTASAGTYFKTTNNAVVYVNDISIQTIACHGDTTASVSLSAAGGTAPYTYTWNTGVVGNSLSNLGYGSYSCTISDAVGSSNVIPIIMYEPPVLNLKSVQTDNNKVQLTCLGGVQPYQYIWFNGAGGNTIEGLTGNTYAATVTDAHGCMDNVSGSLLSYTASVTPILCHGGTEGSISIEVAGGIPPYVYNWQNAPDETTISGLSEATYKLEVTDAANNKAQFSFVIDAPDLLQTNANFNGGMATAAVAGGVPPYTYQWSNGSTTVNAGSGVSPNWFSLTVTDSNGCVAIDSEGIVGGVTETLASNVFEVFPTVLTEGVHTNLQVRMTVPEAMPATVRIIGINGQLLSRGGQTLQAGYNTFEVEADGLPVGFYLLQIESQNGVVVRKFSVAGN